MVCARKIQVVRLAAVTALLLSVSLVACGDDSDTPTGDGGADASTDGGSQPTNSISQCTSFGDMTFHKVEAFHIAFTSEQ